jgi:hypothetical protein
LEQCKQFVKIGVLPELLGKWYSREPMSSATDVENADPEVDSQQQNVWCYCRKEESGEMICCEDSRCTIVWFHTDCLHISKIPKGKWFCPDCTKKRKKDSKIKK